MTTDIEKHEAIIAKLTKKHSELSDLAGQITAKRAALAYPANTGNSDAAKELRGLNKEALEIGLDIENIANAIEAAKVKLDEARKAELLEEKRQNAVELRKAANQLGQIAIDLDQALLTVSTLADKAQQTLSLIHELGSDAPTHSQLQVLGKAAVMTALMLDPSGTRMGPFKIEHIAPNQRRTFSELAVGWLGQIEKVVTPLIGPEKIDKAA